MIRAGRYVLVHQIAVNVLCSSNICICCACLRHWLLVRMHLAICQNQVMSLFSIQRPPLFTVNQQSKLRLNEMSLIMWFFYSDWSIVLTNLSLTVAINSRPLFLSILILVIKKGGILVVSIPMIFLSVHPNTQKCHIWVAPKYSRSTLWRKRWL